MQELGVGRTDSVGAHIRPALQAYGSKQTTGLHLGAWGTAVT